MKLDTLFQHFANQSRNSLWIMRPYNVSALFKLIKQNDIKKVLDLGTGLGLSAATVALAFQQKGVAGHVDTIEQTDKCVKLAGELIPEELKPFITIHKRTPKLWQNPEIPYHYFSTFEDLPEDDYDLIVVDGPGPWAENGKVIDFTNGDVMKLLIENKLKPKTLVAWDGRLRALKMLGDYYGSNFYYFQFASGENDFNVLERKDNEPKFEESKYKTLADLGYFEEAK